MAVQVGQQQLTEPVIRRDHFGTDTDLRWPSSTVWYDAASANCIVHVAHRDSALAACCWWPAGRPDECTATSLHAGRIPWPLRRCLRPLPTLVGDLATITSGVAFCSRTGPSEQLPEPEGYQQIPASLTSLGSQLDVTPSGISRCRQINKKMLEAHAADGFDRTGFIPDSCFLVACSSYRITTFGFIFLLLNRNKHPTYLKTGSC